MSSAGAARYLRDLSANLMRLSWFPHNSAVGSMSGEMSCPSVRRQSRVLERSISWLHQGETSSERPINGRPVFGLCWGHNSHSLTAAFRDSHQRHSADRRVVVARLRSSILAMPFKGHQHRSAPLS
jgi:hypothetical protein